MEKERQRKLVVKDFLYMDGSFTNRQGVATPAYSLQPPAFSRYQLRFQKFQISLIGSWTIDLIAPFVKKANFSSSGI
jgi:hypothetical protein